MPLLPWLAVNALQLAGDPPAADETDAPPLVVTASRTGLRAADDSTLLTADEIQRRAPASTLELLAELPGVRAVSTGGPGGGSFLSIRGGEPNFTLVLIEGIRLNDPTNSRGGAFDFFAIDPWFIGRIEVAPGAVSAVHGSDALSGVVNIRLRDSGSAGVKLFAQASAGSRGDVEVGGGLRGGWGQGGVLAGVSRFDSDELESGSRLRRRQGVTTLAQRFGRFELKVVALYGASHRTLFPEDSGGPLFAVNRALERGDERLWAVGAAIRGDEAAAVRPNLSLSYSRHAAQTDTPAIAPGALPGTPALADDSRFSRFETVADVRARVGSAVVAGGAALLDEQGTNTGAILFRFPIPTTFQLTRRTWSGFAEATLKRGGGFAANLAARYDMVENGSGHLTKRAGASWTAAGARTTVFARYAEGYKLPSFYALAHPLIGNRTLRPERSLGLEAGVEQAISAPMKAKLVLFRNRYRDLVDFDPLAFRLVNRDRVVTRGVEASLEGRLSTAFSLRSALTYLALSSPTPLRQRPRWQGLLAVTWRAAARFDVDALLRGNSSFFDSSIPTGLVRTSGHVEADLSARYRLRRGLSASVSVRNVSGVRYQDAVGFPSAGRVVRVTLSAGFP